MKTKIAFIFTLLALVTLSSALYADCDSPRKNGMMGEGKDGKCGMMGMHGMMQKHVIPTSDGGIVVVHGNKITKYSKKLKFVNEVEIKSDMDGMMKKCPMMKDETQAKDEDEAFSENAADEKSEDTAEHAEHHPD